MEKTLASGWEAISHTAEALTANAAAAGSNAVNGIDSSSESSSASVRANTSATSTELPPPLE